MYFICVMLTSQFCGILVFSIPFVFSEILKHIGQQQLQLQQPQEFSMICLFISIAVVLFTWFVLFRRLDQTSFSKKVSEFDSSFKGIACLPSLMFLSGFSLLNFSFVVIVSASLVVPFYSILSPTKSKPLKFIQFIVLALISPLSIIFLSSLQAGGTTTTGLSAEIYYQFFQQYVQYGNLWFLFGSLIYLPLNISYSKMIFGK